MPIEFRCSQCNKLLRVPDETAGQQAKCPECGALMLIPAASPPPSSSPFASPQTGPGSSFQGTAAPMSADIEFAASEVAGPAIALIVLGSLNVVLWVLATLGNLARVGVGFGIMPMAPVAVVGGMNLIFGVAFLVMSILVIVGAIKMKNLQNYGFAMAASIIAMTPCIWPCCILGLPFGIWSVVVLSNDQVRTAFRT